MRKHPMRTALLATLAVGCALAVAALPAVAKDKTDAKHSWAEGIRFHTDFESAIKEGRRDRQDALHLQRMGAGEDMSALRWSQGRRERSCRG